MTNYIVNIFGLSNIFEDGNKKLYQNFTREMFIDIVK